jgi:hypothetical protein
MQGAPGSRQLALKQVPLGSPLLTTGSLGVDESLATSEGHLKADAGV